PACASCTVCPGRSLPRPRSRQSDGCTVETTSPTQPACVRSNTSWMAPSLLVKNILEDATTILTEGVVESVTLPAHAQTTSEDNGPDLPSIVSTGGTGMTEATGVLNEPDFLDVFAQPAYAVPTNFLFSVCVRIDRAARTFDAFVIVNDGGGF